jgi:aromatic-L-amino-acid decarboxylase
MPPDEFRASGHASIDWVARYLHEVERYPVLSRLEPGELREQLPAHAPEAGEDFSSILADFESRILPAVTHWNHPSFHGYFAVTGSGPGILGELLTAALNVNAMVWRSSPAGTELEQHVLDWLRELVGLPPGFTGVIQDTASVGTLTALCAARHRAYPTSRVDGLWGAPRGRIYASEEAHSSVEKAVIALGLGRESLARIPTDQEYRMRPEALAAAVERDIERGLRPVAVVATVGTTSTSSADPVRAIAEVSARHGMWLHVDAAYAGASAIVPELREHFDGWERAESVVFNPHKWLFTPMDCSVLLTREPRVVRDSLSLTPEYLRTREDPVTTNLMDQGIALGRRFRSLKLWFVLRYFGAEGVRSRIREHARLARAFAGWVDAEPGWQRVAPVPFSTVAFRYTAPGLEADAGQKDAPDLAIDAANLAIMERVNASGEAFLSHTRLREGICLRLSIGNLRTEERHLERTWQLLREAADEVSRAKGAGATTASGRHPRG